MATGSADELCDSAVADIHAGDEVAAEARLREAIRQEPAHAGAWLLLGRILRSTGRIDEALLAARRHAILQPDDVRAAREPVELLASMGRYDEAEAEAARAVNRRPHDAALWLELGKVHASRKRFAAAEAAFVEALRRSPTSAEAGFEIADLAHRTGRPDMAEYYARQSLKAAPHDISAYHQLALILLADDRPGDANEVLEDAARRWPDNADTHLYLARLRRQQNRLEEVETLLRRAMAAAPALVDPVIELAAHLFDAARDADGEAMLAVATGMSPYHPRVMRLHLQRLVVREDLATAAKVLAKWEVRNAQEERTKRRLQGLLHEAAGEFGAAAEAAGIRAPGQENESIDWTSLTRLYVRGHAAAGAKLLTLPKEKLRRLLDEAINSPNCLSYSDAVNGALALMPDEPLFSLAALYGRNYESATTMRQLSDANTEYWNRHGRAPALVRRAATLQSRARVAYVGDYLHSIFMNRHLQHHDFSRFDIFIFTKDKPSKIDPLPGPISIVRPDGDMVELAAKHGIDLAIDVIGPYPSEPLLAPFRAFRRRMAPVQCLWLNTFGPVGGGIYDFILGDDEITPVRDERYYSERIARLPDCHWCFAPPASAPDLSSLPASRNGYVTFGTANRSAKFSDEALDLFARVLARVPNSRFRFLGAHAGEPLFRQRVRARFSAHGIAPGRIDFSGWRKPQFVLDFYNDIDISLDTAPFTGGITTFESIWMGVPVVSLRGGILVSRYSASILATIGRRQWITDTAEDYVECAAGLAADPGTLATERRLLRHRTDASPLCDGPKFARDMETAFGLMLGL